MIDLFRMQEDCAIKVGHKLVYAVAWYGRRRLIQRESWEITMDRLQQNGGMMAHMSSCHDDGCRMCEYLLEFHTACDHCGHIGQIESDGWVGEFENDDDTDEPSGGCKVYCSESCKSKKTEVHTLCS